MNNTKNNNKQNNVANEKQELEIPVEGSLGLLAYGAKGIEAWRKKKQQVKSQQEKPKENE